MKVSIVGPAYPLRGGIAHHVYWLKQELGARNHIVQVISFRQLYPSILFPGSTETDSSHAPLDANGLAVLTALNPMTWARAFRLVRSFQPEIVVFQWWQPFFGPLVGTLARRFRRSGLPCIVECHNVLPHESSPLDRLLTKYAFSPVQEFIVHSAPDGRRLSELAPGRRIGLSPLPTPDLFTSTNPGERRGRQILFFGKVRRYKGLEVLLHAMPKVLAKVDCELRIVGEFYEPLDKYSRIIHALGLESKVRVSNRYVTNEQVAEYFAEADVLVLPYITASQSGVAQIALANALPIIASRAGGLSETIADGFSGLLFDPGDVDQLAERIIAYFTNSLGPVFARNLAAGPRAGCRIAEFIERAASSASDSPAFAPVIVTPTKPPRSMENSEK